MDRRIVFVLQALGLYQILLDGVAARRGTVPLCRGLLGFGHIAGRAFLPVNLILFLTSLGMMS
jgi:hypothetical protein